MFEPVTYLCYVFKLRNLVHMYNIPRPIQNYKIGSVNNVSVYKFLMLCDYDLFHRTTVTCFNNEHFIWG